MEACDRPLSYAWCGLLRSGSCGFPSFVAAKDSVTAGLLERQDDLVHDSTAAIDVALFDLAQFDTVLNVGATAIDGTLDVSLIGGFVVSPSDVFEILTAGSFTEEFINVAEDKTIFTFDV